MMPDEVEIMCKQLKLNKVSGYDGIRVEHFRYADKNIYFTCVLSRVFSVMYLHGNRPECMC